MRRRARIATATAVLCAVTVLVSACASGAGSAQPDASAEGDAARPLTVSNCGRTVVFDHAPERVITIKSTATEMLLALGLGDRIVGSAFQDGPLPVEFAKASVPVIAERMPSQEVVLEAEPDLVYSGWESAFSAEGAGTRDDLAALGIATYVSPAACQSADQPEKLEFESIWGDMTELASIFDTDAADLITRQRALVAAIEPDDSGRTALWYSSGSDTPYVGAGIGAPQLVLETLGLTNIAGHLDATWASFNWEAVVDANPDVIVLVDSTWNSVAKKIGVLEGNPATARLDAVVNRRYLTVPFAASEAGVRTAEAAADLAEQLAAMTW